MNVILITGGTERRQRDVVMTTGARLGRLLKLLAPGVIDKLALRRLKDEARPH